MVLGIKEFFESIKNWMLEHGDNPFLWIGIFLIALMIFWFTYDALHKNK